MKYYVELNVEEHYLNPYEIACKYRIVSKTGQAHNRFVARLLTEYCKKMNIEDKIYYQTKQGMMRVYPASVYDAAIRESLDGLPTETELSMEFENKRHYFIIKNRQQNN
jgi:hypothetical protein